VLSANGEGAGQRDRLSKRGTIFARIPRRFLQPTAGRFVGYWAGARAWHY
jgi:hypothetical protein